MKKNTKMNNLSLTEYPYLEGNAVIKKKASNWPKNSSSVAFKAASDEHPRKGGETVSSNCKAPPNNIPKVVPKATPKAVPKAIPKPVPKAIPKSVPKVIPKVQYDKTDTELKTPPQHMAPLKNIRVVPVSRTSKKLRIIRYS